MTSEVEVIRSPQEGRYYCVTTYTYKTGDNYEDARYFSTNPLRYLGKYIGSRSEGWGVNMKEWSHFINEEGAKLILTHCETTAFYRVV